MVTIVRSLPFRAKSHFWIWLRVNSCMANGTKLPFQVQPARSPLILTSTKTSDSAYFCRGKKMEENCSLRLQPFTFSHEIIQSSFIHQNNGHHFQATTTMIELLLFHFYPFLMISNFEFGPHSARKYRTRDWLLSSSLMHCTWLRSAKISSNINFVTVQTFFMQGCLKLRHICHSGLQMRGLGQPPFMSTS